HVTAPAGLYTLSLHDALPIWDRSPWRHLAFRWPDQEFEFGRSQRKTARPRLAGGVGTSGAHAQRRGLLRPVGGKGRSGGGSGGRSEEHTSELQSRENLVCRLL